MEKTSAETLIHGLHKSLCLLDQLEAILKAI